MKKGCFSLNKCFNGFVVKKDPTSPNDALQLKCIKTDKKQNKLCEYRERLINFINKTTKFDKTAIKMEEIEGVGLKDAWMPKDEEILNILDEIEAKCKTLVSFF